MHIQVNGRDTEIPGGLTARGLVERLELGGKRIAMEVNGEILPRSSYADHQINDGDKIEIIHAVGGG